MVGPGLINWLDAHAGAVTALATVILLIVTIAYVVVTYLLVREQRMQGSAPEVIYEWADATRSNADLRVHNIGNGTAAEVVILLGPEECVEVDMPELGSRLSLLAGEEHRWPIGRPGEASTFPVGDLLLVMYHFDNNRRQVYFCVLLLQFLENDETERQRIADAGSVAESWTCREVKRLGRKSVKWSRKPAFVWRTRAMDLSVLLLDAEARNGVREELSEWGRNLRVWSQQAEAVRERF